MREQTFQRLLKPHSFPLSWRDKKGAPGGIPSRKSRQGFRQNPRRDTQLKFSTGLSIKATRANAATPPRHLLGVKKVFLYKLPVPW